MTEHKRRAVLENPDAYSPDELSDAWEMTAGQCRARGPQFAWAARIAESEARQARAQSRRHFMTEVP